MVYFQKERVAIRIDHYIHPQQLKSHRISQIISLTGFVDCVKFGLDCSYCFNNSIVNPRLQLFNINLTLFHIRIHIFERPLRIVNPIFRIFIYCIICQMDIFVSHIKSIWSFIAFCSEPSKTLFMDEYTKWV